MLNRWKQPTLRNYNKKMFFRWKQLSGKSRITIIILLAITLIISGNILYATDFFAPLSRIDTVAELPPVPIPHAYHRMAVDGKGWLWIAQDAAGTTTNADDQTQLTVIDPGAILQSPVQARICIGCQQIAATSKNTQIKMPVIDDIASVPGQAHSIIVSGWTPDGNPLIVQITLPPNIASCQNKSSCGIILPLLTIDTNMPGVRSSKLQPLIKEFIAIGIHPLMTLAVGKHGDIYSFWSDRGIPSLKDTGTNIVGGFQALLHFNPTSRQWNFAYMGLSGNYTAQQQSPTSFITAIALNNANTSLYIADGDHATVQSIDLTSPLLDSPQPYLAMQAFHRIAGIPADTTPVNTDLYQGVFGWQGDGLLAQHANIGFVRSLAVDQSDDIFLADASNNRIRVIFSAGTIATAAGTGSSAVSGDWVNPSQENLGGITAIATDTSGKLFVLEGATVDQNGQAPIRKISWGWLGLQRATVKAAGAGSAQLTAMLAGLRPHGLQEMIVHTHRVKNCVQGESCAQTYLIAAGGWGAGQWLPGTPEAVQESSLPTASTPNTTNSNSATQNADIMAMIANDQTTASQTALVSDATHKTGYALVVQPSSNAISIIDISAMLQQGSAPVAIGSIRISQPTHCVVSQDNSLTYVGTETGQIFALNTAELLAQGLAGNDQLGIQQVAGMLSGYPITAMALSADQKHLVIAQRQGNDSTITTATVLTNTTGTQLQNIQTTRSTGIITDMALSPNNERLVTIATVKNGAILDVWNNAAFLASQWGPLRNIGTVRPIAASTTIDQIAYYP